MPSGEGELFFQVCGFVEHQESTVATDQPMGQAHQIPVAPSTVRESTEASTTRKRRSVKVAIMKRSMEPMPRRMPSATSLAETTK